MCSKVFAHLVNLHISTSVLEGTSKMAIPRRCPRAMEN